VPGCTLDVSGISMTGSALGSGLTVSIDGTAYKVEPTDPTAHYEYKFSLTYTALGGATVTSAAYTLDVGCTNAVVTWGSYSTSVPLVLDSTPTNVYTFPTPTLSPTYCTIVSTDLVS
jgi:hypothetical protein